MYGIYFLGCCVVSKRARWFSSNSTKKLLEFLATMPKANTSRITDAQKQRHNITKKSEKYSASHVYLQVIGSGARGAPNTLYLFTDQKRYLFNCGECTQRLAHEHKVKLSRLSDIFITSKTWRNIGGLPGLSLTLQDVGVPKITLHGPEGLDELYNATKRFVIMKEMDIKMAKCCPTEDFEDNVMTVKYVFLTNDKLYNNGNIKPTKKLRQNEVSIDKGFEEYINDQTDYYKDESKAQRLNKHHGRLNELRKSPEQDNPKKKFDSQINSHCSVAYICTLKKRFGTLDLAKCVEKGVKPGPQLGQLKAGQNIVLPNGELVLASDVKTPDDPGPVFIVLEVPEISYLKEFEFRLHFDNDENPKENVPTVIVHYTPPHVFNHQRYKDFMALFGPSCQHLVLNSQNTCLGSEAVHRTQHKLHLLDADIFPLLKDVSMPAVWSAEATGKSDSPIMMKGLEDLKNKIAIAQFQNIINMDHSCKGDGTVSEQDGQCKLKIIAGHSLTMFQLRPKKELDRSLEPKLHVQDYIKETMDVDGFVGSLEQFRQMVENIRYLKSELQAEYPKVVFLGTGSSVPSKTRNVSAIVVHVDEQSSLLLDCGEGTFGQLVRFYGPKRVNSFLRTLKGIYISHLHADHHIGLFGVLQARKQAMSEGQSQCPLEPVYLLAPGQIVSWLSTYDQHFERIRRQISLIPNQALLESSRDKHSTMTPAVLAALGLRNIQMCYVSHCPNAFGIAMQIDDQIKITYSGDTIPCQDLIKIGEDSSLLIHEATMEDELSIEARIKMHSTTSQAIDVGKQMNARYTVLTHFSQRYARLPRLSPQILNDNNSVGIAFDNMQITMNDLELLPYMYAPLQLMFAEHCVEMELKAEQRARKRASTSNDFAVTRSGNIRSRSPLLNLPLNLKPQAYYRETNASRLRQESKGMVVGGLVINCRSKSHSPVKKAPIPNSTVNSPARNMATSTVAKVEPQRSRTPTRSCSRSTISSQSKTGTSIKRVPSGKEKEDAILKSKITDGKELRNTPTNPTQSLSLNKNCVKPNSPKVENRSEHRYHTQKETTSNAINSQKKYFPIKQNPDPPKGNRSTTALKQAVAALQQNIRSKPVEGQTPSSSKSSVSSHSHTRRSVTNIKYSVQETMECTDKPISSQTPIKRSATIIKDSVNTTAECTYKHKKCPVYHGKAKRRYSEYAVNLSRPTTATLCKGNKCTPLQTNSNIYVTKGPKEYSKSVKQHVAERNFPYANNKFYPSPGRQYNTNTQSIKSFKPQLADIRSSCFFVNEERKPDNKKAEGPETKNIKSRLTGPSPLNNEERKRLLMQSKRKFQSKSYWNNSKFERIEGLNWISWK